MIFDEDGLLEEPCLSCDKAYVEDIWNGWCCDEKECPYIKPMNDDCISREAVIQIINNQLNPCTNLHACMEMNEIKERVKDLEPVTPKKETVTEFADKCRECGSIIGKHMKQKTGRWISHKEYCEKHDLIPSGLVTLEWCSNCDYGVDINKRGWDRYKYCPNCGAKMAESED